MRSRPLVSILLTIFMDMVGIGILFPVIPQLLGNPDSPQYMLPDVSQQQGYLLLGALVACYPLAQFFAAPLLGQLSDRYGRRPVLLVSIFGTAVGYVLFAVAILTKNLPLLFASRMLDGMTGGNISVAQAAIADITPQEKRAKNFGLMGAVFGIGFVVGPFIGGHLADATVVSWFNAATPFWFAAGLCILNMFSILVFLPETRQVASTAPFRFGQSVRHIIKACTLKDIRWMFAVGFLFQGGFSFFTTFFGVYLISRFAFTESDIGNFFAYVGICIAITQAFITPRVSRRFGEWNVVGLGLIATGCALLLYVAPGPWTILIAVTPIFAVCNGVTQANFMALLSRRANQDTQGEVLGINASVAALSQAIPPVLAGLIAASSAPSATILVAAVIGITPGVVFRMTVKRLA